VNRAVLSIHKMVPRITALISYSSFVNMFPSLSVVIPTYNRPNQLATVLDRVLSSEISDIPDIEVIVVDDGSPESAESIVNGKAALDEKISFRCITQPNSGPAAARNNGFSHSVNEIVLFVDDDVLLDPKTIMRHLTVHRSIPNCVVFGPCPYVIPESESPAYRYLKLLDSSYGSELTDDLNRVNIVASGNLSVQRSMFINTGVYRTDLKTPAAEEFEFEHRLHSADVPIYLCRSAVAWHLQPATIKDKCIQEFKYGIGAAEILSKFPQIIENEHLLRIIRANDLIRLRDGPRVALKKSLKQCLSHPIIRCSLVKGADALQKLVPYDPLLFSVFRFLCGLHLFAGVRTGLRTYTHGNTAAG